MPSKWVCWQPGVCDQLVEGRGAPRCITPWLTCAGWSFYSQEVKMLQFKEGLRWAVWGLVKLFLHVVFSRGICLVAPQLVPCWCSMGPVSGVHPLGCGSGKKGKCIKMFPILTLKCRGEGCNGGSCILLGNPTARSKSFTWLQQFSSLS